MHFDTAKSRDVLCRACLTARRDMLVTTSATGATRTTRVHGRRHSVDWVGYVYLTFPEVFPETDAIPEHKRLNSYTRALLLLRRPPCWNKHGSTHSTRSSRRVRRDCRVVTQQAEYAMLSW